MLLKIHEGPFACWLCAIVRGGTIARKAQGKAEAQPGQGLGSPESYFSSPAERIAPKGRGLGCTQISLLFLSAGEGPLGRATKEGTMRRVSEHAYAEIYFWGCNPGFVVTDEGVVMIDTPQQPIDAVRWRERLLELGPIRYLVNTEPHPDHIRGNAYFPGVEVVGQVGLLQRYEEAIPQMAAPELLETVKQSDPDSVWLFNHPSYPPNPPTRIFTDELTLNLGRHTITCLHIPGHTAPQTAVYLPEEGVVFTGDNIFNRVKTFIQEADPWEWLAALRRIGELDAAVIVPGHGEPCDNSYLKEQAQVIENWVGAVEDFVRRGLTEEEALQQPVPQADPYPIGQRLFPRVDWVNELNVTNLYRRIIARQSQQTV